MDIVLEVARATATTGDLHREGARTQRTLVRGTAKRLLQKARQAAPSGARARSVSVTGLENSRFSGQPVAEATLNCFVKSFWSFCFSERGEFAREIYLRQSAFINA